MVAGTKTGEVTSAKTGQIPNSLQLEIITSVEVFRAMRMLGAISKLLPKMVRLGTTAQLKTNLC